MNPSCNFSIFRHDTTEVRLTELYYISGDRAREPRQSCGKFGYYIVMLRARMFRSLIIRAGIKERNIRARDITILPKVFFKSPII